MCKYQSVISEVIFPVLGITTMCVIKTKFGFDVGGQSVCSSKNWTEEKAMSAAKADAEKTVANMMKFKTMYNQWSKAENASIKSNGFINELASMDPPIFVTLDFFEAKRAFEFVLRMECLSFTYDETNKHFVVTCKNSVTRDLLAAASQYDNVIKAGGKIDILAE
jgi:hypothetical protein